MSNYRQDSAYTGISRRIPAIFETLSPDDKATFRYWRRAILSFYAAVLLMGGARADGFDPSLTHRGGAGHAGGERSLTRFRENCVTLTDSAYTPLIASVATEQSSLLQKKAGMLRRSAPRNDEKL